MSNAAKAQTTTGTPTVSTGALGIQPIGGKIVVLPEEKETVTSFGLVIPDNISNEKPQMGKIVALGSGKITKSGKVLPFSVKVGDKVLFKKYSPDEVEVKGSTYLIMEESDILGIIQG